MTTYFDPSSTDSLNLLPKSTRVHDDLAVVAADAETDVIAQYTRRAPVSTEFVNVFYSGRGYYAGDGVWVALRNYLPDASQCTDASLVLALRRTIADVIAWRLGKRNEALHVESVSQNGPGTFKKVRDEVVNAFPPGNWGYRLELWDIRTPVYST